MNEPEQSRPSLTPEQARLLPFYHDLKNEIVEPDKVVVSSQYFWTRWAPRLGPTLTALVVCLRRHCYYNKLTQERRDWCFPEQATLAREIGVESTKTIRAALQHPEAAYFVRREARYVYDPHRGKKVRTSDMYYVAMDDPLTPEDEALLVVRATERLLTSGRREELGLPEPKGEIRRQVARRPEGKNRRQVPNAPFCPQDSTDIFAPEEVHELDTVKDPGTLEYSNADLGGDGAYAHERGGERPPSPADRSFVVFPDLPVQSRPLWRAICDEAARRIPALTDRALLSGSVLLAREGEALVVGVGGRAAVRRAETRLRAPLLAAIRAVLGRPVGVRFVASGEWTPERES